MQQHAVSLTSAIVRDMDTEHITRKRAMHWRQLSAMWLIQILAVKECTLAFDLPRPRPSFQRDMRLYQTVNGGPMKRIKKWISPLPKVPQIHTVNVNPINNDDDDEMNLPKNEKFNRNNIFRGIRIRRKQTTIEMDSPHPANADRSVPRRLPRFRRYRTDPMKEQDRAVSLTEKQTTRSGKPTMFWRRINRNINRGDPLDSSKNPIQQIDVLEWNSTTQILQNNLVKSSFMAPTKTTARNKSMNDKNLFGSENRVKFSAAHQESRFITLEDSFLSHNLNLLHEYMSRPISSFSIRSFHDDEMTSSSHKSTQHRRWLVRKLTIEEAIQDGVLNVDLQDERYFRLAVPLLPLVGVHLTPVVDFEVLSIQSNNIPFISESNPHMLKIRSMRLSLLSKEDEVRKAMEDRKKEKIQSPRPTKVSQNQNVREIGNNAIEMVSKMEDIIKPYFSFDATITWTDGDTKVKTSSPSPVLCIKATTTASFTWNQKNIVHPYVLEKISEVILKRALKFGLMQMLRQIERDFKQWARLSHEE